MLIKTIEINKKCEAPNCNRYQSVLVYSFDKKEVLAVCYGCLERILDESAPEYISTCPNCRCHRGVG